MAWLSPFGRKEGWQKTVDISVVVVTYNRAGMLRQALKTLVNQVTEDKFSCEILVIDDGSTDMTADIVDNFVGNSPKSVRYVYKEHGGEGDARNKGVSEARGEWIAFFDDDQLAEPVWLAELYKIAQEKGVACVDGPLLLKLPDSSHLHLGPKSRKLLGEKIFAPNTGLHLPTYYVGAGNVLIRKSLFEELGLFDVTFRQGVDTDFFWRLEKNGFHFYYSPRAVGYHVIPDWRLQVPYLRKICLRRGVADARIRLKYEEAPQLILAIFWRIGLALGRDIPFILLAGMLKDQSMFLDSWIGLWSKIGFFRKILFSIVPGLFPQREFFSSLEEHL